MELTPNRKLIMEKPFTPGPWNVGPTPHYLRMGQDGTPLTIRSPHHTEEICTVWTCLLPTEANARLIASAPELLEALEYVMQTIENYDEWWIKSPDKGGFDMNRIISALNKAKGIK